MKKYLSLIMALSPGFLYAQDAPLKNIRINGWGFFRHETKKDADYKSSIKDNQNYKQTRLNLIVRGDLAENYGEVVFSPQFSKISGLTEFNGATSTTNVSSQSSGNLYDPRLDLHEGYIVLKPTQDEKLQLLTGRQEFNYGDHLVVGSVPWHRIGRSFDAVRLRVKESDRFALDAFVSTLQENNASTTAAATGAKDANFNGIYLYGNQGNYFNSTDLYVLKKENQITGSFNDTLAYGLRLKSKLGETAVDYRAEGTLQQTRLMGESKNQDAYQYDLELGYAVPFYGTRLAFEYFDSSKNYDQLFPTAHKFLGYADQFSRRNIKGYVGHLSIKPLDKVTFFADYHIFQRSSKNDPAYNFTGGSLGSVGNSREIANELDLILAYDFSKTVQLSCGYSLVNPGKYLKDQDSAMKSQTEWSFLQLLVRF